jgi:hypothetical protein
MTQPKQGDLVERLREFEISDALGDGDFSTCKEAADRLEIYKAEIEGLLALLIRYRNETPPGHSPHMICHVVDAAIEHARTLIKQEDR